MSKSIEAGTGTYNKCTPDEIVEFLETKQRDGNLDPTELAIAQAALQAKLIGTLKEIHDIFWDITRPIGSGGPRNLRVVAEVYSSQ
jgi:hypothetical protein